MAKRPTRLRFTEDDLTDSKVKKAAEKAEKAADKADHAVNKLPKKKPHRKLRMEMEGATNRKAKLRFEKAPVEEIAERPSRARHLVSRATVGTVAGKLIKRYLSMKMITWVCRQSMNRKGAWKQLLMLLIMRLIAIS